MKIKSLLLFFLVCLITLLIPNCVQATTGVDGYGNEYEILDDSTVKLTYVKPNQQTCSIDGKKYSSIVLGPEIDGKNYTLISISANALDGITDTQDLYVSYCEEVTLETTNPSDFFKNIDYIYIQTGTHEDYIAAGWPEEKLKHYKIKEQPQDITVTAGDMKDTDTLKISVEAPLGVYNIYSWYYCDKNGNITDEESIGNNATFSIPEDLSYDNDNNASKDYYFTCVIGENYPNPEYSRVVKVTVNPGVYKVSFHLNRNDENPVILTVNDERKLESSDLSKIPTLDKLNEYKEGTTFLGWTTDGIKIIKQEDLETTVFDKNTNLYPVWQTKITIDANGGKFADGSTKFVYTLTNWGEVSNLPSEPIREGYEVVNITDQKDGGTPPTGNIEELLKKGDITLYVQWKSTSEGSEGGVANGTESEKNEQEADKESNKDKQESDKGSSKGDKDDTPKTGESVMPYEVIFTLSSVGLATIFVTSKKRVGKH